MDTNAPPLSVVTPQPDVLVSTKAELLITTQEPSVEVVANFATDEKPTPAVVEAFRPHIPRPTRPVAPLMTENAMNTSDLKDKIVHSAERAKDTAVSALDAATEAGRKVKDEMSARAAETIGTVRDAANERAGEARDTLVDTADRLAQSLQDQADGSDGMQSRILTGLADGVTSVTDHLRGRTLGDLLADAQSYARQHPGAFAVGAAVAGFALARFLRASDANLSAQQRAAKATDRFYRDAARRTVDSLGQNSDAGSRA